MGLTSIDSGLPATDERRERAEEEPRPPTTDEAGNGRGSGVTTEAPQAHRPPSKSGRLGRILASVVGAIPTILVFGTLAALGYWGHHTGWKMPAFSELTGDAKTEAKNWCDEHGVPESICIACNADLMPKGTLYGWCKEHGVAECVLEHPELVQLDENPTILPEDIERARRALTTRERPKNDPLCKMHLRRIQFATREAAEKAGIDIALVERGRTVETIPANGEIRYDPTLVTRVSTRAGGTVWRVDKTVGDQVDEGELLALVDAAAVGQSKSELLQAVAQLELREKNLDRVTRLGKEKIVEGRRVIEAVAARDEARASVRKSVQTLANLGLSITFEQLRGKKADELVRTLHFLGLPAEVCKRLNPQQTTANLIPVFAPRQGEVVSRDVVAGEVVDTTKTLFTIVDTRQMWLLIDVPIEDSQYIALGQKVVFRPDGSPQMVRGTLTWKSTQIDRQTRTIKVRAELANEDGSLRDESFGSAEIMLREEENAILTPKDAIHWEGCCHIAFVRDKDYFKEGSYKVFHTRMVRPGVTNGDNTEVIAGLFPGEVVVTKGSGVLRSELLKGNLGAG